MRRLLVTHTAVLFAPSRASRILRDDATRRKNMDVGWQIAPKSVVKLRIVNDPKSFHEHLEAGMMTVPHVARQP